MTPTSRFTRIAALALALAASTAPAFAGKQPRVNLDAMHTPLYDVEGDAFVRHNGDRYSNRPLYCNQIYAIALGGDKPFFQVGDKNGIQGGLMFALGAEWQRRLAPERLGHYLQVPARAHGVDD